MPEQPFNKSWSELLREAASSFSALLRSELELARLELFLNLKDAGRQSVKVIAAGVLIFFAGLALLASLIIGVGAWMGGRYGWAALIVAAICVGGAVMLGVRAAQQIAEDSSLPLSRLNFRDDQTALKAKILDITDRIRTREGP